MELDALAERVHEAIELRRRLQRQENAGIGNDEIVGEAVARPRSAKSVASYGPSYVGSVHSIRLVPVNGYPQMKFWKCEKAGFWGILKTTVSLIFYVLLNIFAFLNYFSSAKYFLIKFLSDQSLVGYIDFGFDAMLLIQGCYYILLLIYDGPFTDFLSYVREIETGRAEKDQLTSPRTVKITTLCIFGTSVLSAAMYVADCGGGIEGIATWTQDKWLLQLHAWLFSMALFVWTRSGYNKYAGGRDGLVRSPTNVGFGTANVILSFCSNLHSFIIQDVVLSNTLTYFLEARELARICTPDARTVDEATVQVRRILKTKGLGKRYNKAFGNLIRVSVVANMFMFTYLLGEAIENDTYALMNLAMVIASLKAIAFYVISCKIYDYGQVSLLCAKNLKETFGEVTVDGEVVSLSVLVNQLEAEPIGVGKHAFLINEAFAIGIVSGVFAIFGMMAAGLGKA